jgi:hypothetical protein
MLIFSKGGPAVKFGNSRHGSFCLPGTSIRSFDDEYQKPFNLLQGKHRLIVAGRKGNAQSWTGRVSPHP